MITRRGIAGKTATETEKKEQKSKTAGEKESNGAENKIAGGRESIREREQESSRIAGNGIR